MRVGSFQFKKSESLNGQSIKHFVSGPVRIPLITFCQNSSGQRKEYTKNLSHWPHNYSLRTAEMWPNCSFYKYNLL